MKSIKVILALLLIFSIISCEKNKSTNKKEFETISTSEAKFDLVFPQELWDKILETAPPTLSTKKSVYELYESLFMHVDLIDGTKEVLGGKNFRFVFKEFGGEIDFNTYLKRDVIGNFKMHFEFPALEEENLHVFYLSWAKQYTKDEETFGSECGYFYDVTSYFKKEVFKKDLLLHTNNYRYFDLVGGRLYFVNYTLDKIQVAQITLTDSSLADRLCKEKL